MKTPFFTLITPVYNIEKLLAKTIESAISQTFTDWEMVLVDDGSPDNAGKICDAYAAKDSRIKVVHKKNEGLAEARNEGLKRATGKYFIILEGSDLFPDNNTLEKIHADLLNNEVDIYFGRLADVDDKTGNVFYVQDEYKRSGRTFGGKELFCALYNDEETLALSSPVNKVFKTEFVNKNNLRFCKGIYHDDDEWLPRAISLSQTAFFTNDIIYCAMVWDGCFGQTANEKSLTKKAVDKTFLAKRCIEDILVRFPKEKGPFISKYVEYYVRIYLSGVGALNYVKNDEYRKNIFDAAMGNSVLKYTKYCESKNLKLLGKLKAIFGFNFAIKMILKRYGK